MRQGLPHDFREPLDYLSHLLLGGFEDELIMDCQHHGRLQVLSFQFGFEVDHGFFQNIGGRPLDGSIDRRPRLGPGAAPGAGYLNLSANQSPD